MAPVLDDRSQLHVQTLDAKITESTLKNWAESLRNAIETLSKAQ